MGKEKMPKHIKEFYVRGEKIDTLLATTQAVHSEAYQRGLSELKNEKGEIDYTKLEEVKVQDQFLDKMIGHYITSAVQSLGLKNKPKDELEQEMLLQHYIGITKGELRKILRENESKYTLKKHEELRESLIQNQRQKLIPLRHNHFEDKHIDDILKYVGVQDYIMKDRIRIEHAANLLDLHKSKHGADVTLEDLGHLTSASPSEGGWESTVYLTPEAKKKLKEKPHR